MPANSKTSKKSRSKRVPAYKRFIAVRSYAVNKSKDFLSRRPHRTFKLTKRRDYKRSLQIPGFFAFTAHVNKVMWNNRKLFLGLALVYAALTLVAVGISSQDAYSSLTSSLQEAGAEIAGGDISQLGQAGLVFLAIMTNGLSGAPNESQQTLAAMLVLLVWLTTVWLLRNSLAGHKIKLRDGLYNAGAPIVSTFLVAVVLVLQAIPVGIAVIGYSAASATGVLDGGVEAMLFWIAAGMLTVLSLYLMSGTFFSMIVASLPGMYPMRALKTGGDLVVGRRIRIIARLLWMLLCVLIGWALVAIPFILFDAWIKGVWPQVEWLPIIPVVILILSVGSVIWMASYIYLLYRKVVDDDTKPA